MTEPTRAEIAAAGRALADKYQAMTVEAARMRRLLVNCYGPEIANDIIIGDYYPANRDFARWVAMPAPKVRPCVTVENLD